MMLLSASAASGALIVTLISAARTHRREAARDVADVRIMLDSRGSAVVENRGPRDAFSVGILGFADGGIGSEVINIGTLPAGTAKNAVIFNSSPSQDCSLFLSWTQGAAQVVLKELRYDSDDAGYWGDGYPALIEAMRTGRSPRQIRSELRRRATWNAVRRWL